MNDVMKWRDGSDVICEICHQPIYSDQPVVATITHNIKKRHAKHFLCDGGTITVIGNNQVTVFKKE